MDELMSDNAVGPTEALPPSADDRARAAAETKAPPADRPHNVPEMFWDAERGSIRVDELLKAHLDLLADLPVKEDGTIPASEEADAVTEEGEPNDAEDPAPPYEIEPPHPLLASNDDVNLKLHQAGLSQEQAQTVYDLAADVLLPLIEDVAWEGQAARHVARLSEDFGGAEAWSRTAQQLRTWGQANLTPHVYAALASDPEGIHAMHQMMRSKEPRLVGQADASLADLDETALNEMVKDPRYWRDRDQDFVAQVTAGFKKLYRR